MNEARWTAVHVRDKSMDGQFVYGVLTTGVFCRPSCRARRPLRQNVRFYDDGAEALAAGFRPCLRCRPGSLNPKHPHGQLMEKLCEYIHANLDADLSLERLGDQAQMSPGHLENVFQSAIGVTPREYVEARRFQILRKVLRGVETVTEAVHAAGFGSSARVYETAGARLGMTPGQYKKGGAHQPISYALLETKRFQWVLLAATDRGVCFIAMGDSKPSLIQEFRAEFPSATIAESAGGEEMEAWCSALLDFLKGKSDALKALPLDISGTVFQQQVWRFLQQIPAGEARSYTEVAAGIGMPKAVRAVAGACAANRVALAIPCHRVIRGDGSVSGFRWGAERKRQLLEMERANVRH